MPDPNCTQCDGTGSTTWGVPGERHPCPCTYADDENSYPNEPASTTNEVYSKAPSVAGLLWALAAVTTLVVAALLIL